MYMYGFILGIANRLFPPINRKKKIGIPVSDWSICYQIFDIKPAKLITLDFQHNCASFMSLVSFNLCPLSPLIIKQFRSFSSILYVHYLLDK